MATNLKILGQLVPSAASLEDLYTVPSATQSVGSSLVICNTSATPTTFRVAVRESGAAIEAKHYIYYNVTIAGNDTFIATIGLSLKATDVVSVYATLGTLSFNLFGQENT